MRAPASEAAGAAAIEADGLARRFGELTALDDLSFRVDRGELVGVVGPDGAGKTTLMRILAGILPPTEGDVSLLGRSVSGDPEAVKFETAYMPQRFGLYEDLTVAENLAFYADLYRVPKGERRARLERLYQFSRLGPFAGRLAGKLSGGMKQKLALSCCLVHQPRILLLDEPTFGVDPISRRDLWLILHEMVQSGITVVVSTSYLDEAERCDRVLLLDRGRAMDMDTPERLLAGLPGLLLEVRTSDPRRARDVLRQHLAGVGTTALFGERLHVLVPDRDLWRQAEELLAGRGIRVQGVRPVEPSLEDVFIHRARDPEGSDV